MAVNKLIRLSVISVVGKECLEEMSRLKKEFCDFSHSYASLQFPPHITLAHLKMARDKQLAFYDYLDRVLREHKQFPIRTDKINFKTYEEKGKTKYTARFDVMENPQLTDLRTAILDFPSEEKKPFDEPHITLVFGDLTEEKFLELQKYLTNRKSHIKDFEYALDNVSVLDKHGRNWFLDRYFPLSA